MELLDRIKEIEQNGIQAYREQQVLPDSLINWLAAKGFFTAPASKDHHGAEIGCLCKHSLTVAQELCDITNKMDLLWTRKESPLYVGLLHDVCKTEDYRIILDEKEKKGYRIEWNNEKLLPGHGDKSVMMIQQYCMESGEFMLTHEEMMCIRYHMGAFTDKKEWDFYSRVVGYYPTVLWTHTADMIASQVMGV